MTGQHPAQPIAVAVDGSPSALRAARWAAAEAMRRCRGLLVVHAYPWPLPTYGPVFGDPAGLYGSIRSVAEAVVGGAARHVEQVAPWLSVTTEVLRGSPRVTLEEVSRRAAMLVLGSRGLGGFTGLLAGSVTVSLTAHGHCPVAVIRGEEQEVSGPVVVGVDGSPRSGAAVALAFDEASTRETHLLALHAWGDDARAGHGGSGAARRPAARHAEDLLAERLAGWQEKYPEVAVRRVVLGALPAGALIEAVRDAQLLVVGSRGRGGFAGLMLGSVSRAVIQHAPCPVIVVRATRD